MNKILDPGGTCIYLRGSTALRVHGNFLGLWRLSREQSEEGDHYTAYTLLDVFDSYNQEDAIEAAVAAVRHAPSSGGERR